MLHGFIMMTLLLGRPDMSTPTIAKAALFAIVPQIVTMPSIDDVLRACNAGDAIRGCTMFVGETLTPHYKAGRAGWSMQFTGGMRAMVVVSDPRIIGHELKHIRDIHNAVDRFLHDAESVAYPSQEACMAAAGALQASFHSTLKTMAAVSNATLH